MTRRSRFWLVFAGAFLLMIALIRPSLTTYFFPGHLMEKIDFKNLDFTCSREQDHVPTPTPQAEALYQQAYVKNVAAMSGDVPNVPLLNEAIRDYEKAAKANHWKAVRNLANIYTSGVDIRYAQGAAVKPDSDLAVRYTKQLIEMNVATGFNLMAIYADEGWGVRQDPKASLMFLRRAADLGLPVAQRQLGKKFLYEFRDLPPAERSEIDSIGLKMLACAVRQGDVESALELGIQYENLAIGNYASALFYFQQGGKMGDGTCLVVLSEWFKVGKYGYSADSERAEKYYAFSKRVDVREGPFPELDRDLPLPPPNGGSYPPPEVGWPNEWTKL